MDQIAQQTPQAEILSFPQMSRKDDELLQTVLNNLSQRVLMFDSETRLIFLQSPIRRNVWKRSPIWRKV